MAFWSSSTPLSLETSTRSGHSQTCRMKTKQKRKCSGASKLESFVPAFVVGSIYPTNSSDNPSLPRLWRTIHENGSDGKRKNRNECGDISKMGGTTIPNGT